MTFQGTLVLDIAACLLLIWILDLTRRGRLYVGYAVLFVVTLLGSMLVISVPPLLDLVTRSVGALFPVSALTLLAIGFVTVVLVYTLTQITILSNRLAELVQELAIRRLREEGDSRRPPAKDPE
jgi:hypothetical protein